MVKVKGSCCHFIILLTSSVEKRPVLEQLRIPLLLWTLTAVNARLRPLISSFFDSQISLASWLRLVARLPSLPLSYFEPDSTLLTPFPDIDNILTTAATAATRLPLSFFSTVAHPPRVAGSLSLHIDKGAQRLGMNAVETAPRIEARSRSNFQVA